MLILAIDTSTDTASIALATEEVLISELNFRHKMDLLRRLTGNIDRLVVDANRTPGDLDGVVISLGPGSFTGLRIGMAAAKSIAHTLAKPIVGVPTLDVLAHGASAACPKLIIPLIHARPGEVFRALYMCESGQPKRLTDDQISTIEDVIREGEAEKEVVFCGEGAERNRKALEDRFGTASILPEWFRFPRAAILARLGIERLSLGDSNDLASLVPRYIRRPTPVVRLEGREWE